MARIAGVDLPREKRVEIALTYIFGIGRSTAKEIVEATGISQKLVFVILQKKKLLSFVNTLIRTLKLKGIFVVKFP